MLEEMQAQAGSLSLVASSSVTRRSAGAEPLGLARIFQTAQSRTQVKPVAGNFTSHVIQALPFPATRSPAGCYHGIVASLSGQLVYVPDSSVYRHEA
jgi:hypothetical protein